MCQHWDTQSPHSHSYGEWNGGLKGNQCMQLGETFYWCYTQDSSVRWERCDCYVWIGRLDPRPRFDGPKFCLRNHNFLTNNAELNKAKIIIKQICILFNFESNFIFEIDSRSLLDAIAQNEPQIWSVVTEMDSTYQSLHMKRIDTAVYRIETDYNRNSILVWRHYRNKNGFYFMTL